MAVIKKSELSKLSLTELETKLFDLRKELNSQKGAVASGGRAQNPGKIKEIRRTIARILTIVSKSNAKPGTDVKIQQETAEKSTEVKSSG